MNIPNSLTLLRIGLISGFCGGLLTSVPTGRKLATAAIFGGGGANGSAGWLFSP